MKHDLVDAFTTAVVRAQQIDEGFVAIT